MVMGVGMDMGMAMVMMAVVTVMVLMSADNRAWPWIATSGRACSRSDTAHLAA